MQKNSIQKLGIKINIKTKPRHVYTPTTKEENGGEKKENQS